MTKDDFNVIQLKKEVREDPFFESEVMEEITVDLDLQDPETFIYETP